MKYEKGGLSLAFGDDGTGPAVVLIHGFPLNRQMWSPQISALAAAGYRVITPDLRGFGESGAGTDTCSMDTYADDLVAILDHLKIEKAVVGGMSMGGYVLLNLLARYPQRIVAPCFIVTRSGADDEAGQAKRRAMADDARKFGAEIVADVFAKVLFSDETIAVQPELVGRVAGWMAAADSTGMANGLLAMAGRPDRTPLLRTIAAPSLVIGATDDRAMARENFDILVSGLPNGTSCMIPRAGHMVNLEKADQFNACLLKFLQGLNLNTQEQK